MGKGGKEEKICSWEASREIGAFFFCCYSGKNVVGREGVWRAVSIVRE